MHNGEKIREGCLRTWRSEHTGNALELAFIGRCRHLCNVSEIKSAVWACDTIVTTSIQIASSATTTF